MFLHLSHDEKFIDAARDSFERAAPGQHVFVVVDAVGPLKYIRSFEPRRMSLEQLLDPAFLATLPDYDAVFLHSLNKPNRLVVDRAPAQTCFAWIGWGYDYYALLGEDLLLPQTRALMATIKRETKADTLAAFAKEALLAPGRIPAALRSRRIRAGGRDELALLQKIAFFAPVLSTEYTRVRDHHPGFRPRFSSWNYAAHEMLDAVAPSRARVHRVVVGNSATPECNHLEAFEALAGFDGDVLVPLSYGNAQYRDAMLRAGRARLGDRFHPLTEFMAPDAYAQLIADSSHLVMNHLRQQGLANILIAMRAGTRVVMQRNNPLFDWAAETGLQVDDIAEGLQRAELDEAIVSRNRAVVAEVFGAARHDLRTRAFLDAVTHTGEHACIA